MHRGVLWIFMLLRMQDCLAQVSVDIDPREAVVLPGQNVTYVCRVGVPIQYCRVEIPGLSVLNLNKGQGSAHGVSYYGAGHEAGQCGFTIARVEDRHNGQIKCYLGVPTQVQEASGSMELTVAKAPRSPELELSRGTDSLGVYKVNDFLQASCVIRDGRPVANISWYLDNEPIYGDELTMPTITNIAKENLFTKMQNLTRTLQPSDNGKTLRCVATHIALRDQASVAQKQLDVKFPPLPQRNPIDLFGYELGRPGIIYVEVVANPKPQFEWRVRDQHIKEGNVDNTGRIEAEAAKDLGKGRYLVNLHLAAITKQDTETQYILTAYNDMGSQEYFVQISTSPEPEGLELGVGAIVGIVAAILVLLLVVFLLLFARVTGRWCFSGGARDGGRRAAGESSDTESADVRAKEVDGGGGGGGGAPASKKKSATPLKLTVTNIFRKGKDKVAVAGKPDEENGGEPVKAADDVKKVAAVAPPAAKDGDDNKQQKQALVYAELDLVSPANQARPLLKNDDDKTEYAEIVYTPNKEPEPGEEEKKNGGET